MNNWLRRVASGTTFQDYLLSISDDLLRFNPWLGKHVEIDPSQDWFWTPKWLAGELEVEDDGDAVK